MRRPEIQERIVKVELTYYRHTHKPDVTVRPDLFRLNKIPHKERLENFTILTDTDNSTATIVDRPSNMMLSILSVQKTEQICNIQVKFKTQ